MIRDLKIDNITIVARGDNWSSDMRTTEDIIREHMQETVKYFINDYEMAELYKSLGPLGIFSNLFEAILVLKNYIWDGNPRNGPEIMLSDLVLDCISYLVYLREGLNDPPPNKVIFP